MVFPDGTIYQWGMASLTNDDRYVVFNTVIPFTSAFVSLQLTPAENKASVDDDDLSAHGYIQSLSSFGYGLSDSNGGWSSVYGVYWEAIGY